MKNILKTTILTLVGVALITPAADAALNYAGKNLIVAFSATQAGASPRSANTTYFFNLGPISQFQTGGSYVTTNPVILNSTSAAALKLDLGNAGIPSTGAFSLFAEDNDGAAMAWLSKAETTKGTSSTPWVDGHSATAANDMQTWSTALVSPGATTAPGSTKQLESQTNSYAQYVLGQISPTQSWETYGNPEGSFGQVLDLYELNDSSGPPPSTSLGAFAFDYSSGALSFSSDIGDFSAVPEPSTIGFGLLALGACIHRRQRRVAVPA